jgi:hypothetical protein
MWLTPAKRIVPGGKYMQIRWREHNGILRLTRHLYPKRNAVPCEVSGSGLKPHDCLPDHFDNLRHNGIAQRL